MVSLQFSNVLMTKLLIDYFLKSLIDFQVQLFIYF